MTIGPYVKWQMYSPQRDQSQMARQAAHGGAPLPEARIPTLGEQCALPYAQERGLWTSAGRRAKQELGALRVLLYARPLPDWCDQPRLGPSQRLATAQDYQGRLHLVEGSRQSDDGPHFSAR